MTQDTQTNQNQSGTNFVLRSEPRIASFAEGVSWFTDGFKLVAKNPVGWISFFFIWFILTIPGSLIPLISVLLHMLLPVFVGGVMWGSYQLDKTNTFNPLCLFYGFQRNFTKLFTLGLFYSAGGILIGLILNGLLLAFGFDLENIQNMSSSYLQQQMRPEEVLLFMQMLLVILLGMLALSIPLFMAIWFAPALVIINNVAPMTALKLSFIACLRNMISFLSYGLVGFAACVIAFIPFGLGFIVLIPVIFASIYTSYKNIFIDESGKVDSGSGGSNSDKTSKPDKKNKIGIEV